MPQRRLLRWSLILAILAAFTVWLEPTRVVWGWLRGAAFLPGAADVVSGAGNQQLAIEPELEVRRATSAAVRDMVD